MECLGNDSVIFLHIKAEGCQNFVVCLLEVVTIIALTSLILTFNLLHLIVLLWSSSLRNCHGYLIISLSLSDFINGLTAALSIYPSATFSESCWPYGEAVCAVAAYLSNVSAFNSLLTLTLLSVERYIAAAFPLRYSLIVTKRTTLTTIVTCWLINAASQTTIFAGIPGFVYVPDLYACFPQYFESPTYAAVMILGVAVPCFIVNMVSSCIVRWKLAKSSRRRNLMIAPTTTFPGKGPSQVRRQATSNKLARMVRIMTTALVLTWMPFFTVSMLSVFGGLYIPQPLTFCVYMLLLSNGFLNSFIYFGMNNAFREALGKILSSLTPHACLRVEKLEARLFGRVRSKHQGNAGVTLPTVISTQASEIEVPKVTGCQEVSL